MRTASIEEGNSKSANDAEIFVAMQQHALFHGYVPVVYFVGDLTDEQRREVLVKILARRPLALQKGEPLPEELTRPIVPQLVVRAST